MGINLLLSVEPIEVFFGILIIIGSVLSIILFFKIWKMTNNVQEILDLLEYRIAPDVNALSNIKTKESQSKESGNLIGQSYTDDDDLIGQFYGEARQLQLSLLSDNPDTAKENFNLKIGTIVEKYQHESDKKRLNIDFKAVSKNLWEELNN